MRNVILIICLFTCQVQAATQALYPIDNPDIAQRFDELLTQYRCLVCQNEDLASSNADLAKDLRKQIYQRVISGQTDEQIKSYLVTRYGQFILYKPPLQKKTLILWGLPFVLLITALACFIYVHKRKSVH